MHRDGGGCASAAPNAISRLRRGFTSRQFLRQMRLNRSPPVSVNQNSLPPLRFPVTGELESLRIKAYWAPKCIFVRGITVRLALRMTMACLAVGLAVSAFRLARLQLSVLALASVFCIFCAARLQNDWRDRYQDVKRGKSFAFAHAKLFLLCLLSCWAVCCLLVGAVALQNGPLALLLAAMGLAGLLYSETRKLPWVPILISAITSASPAFLPSTLEPDMDRMLPLFAAAALYIFGREILKDLEDVRFDEDYKWTIPLAYGDRIARRLAVVSVAGACISVATISSLAVAGILAAAIGLVLFCRNISLGTTMNWLDAGAALVILALVAFPPLPNLLT